MRFLLDTNILSNVTRYAGGRAALMLEREIDSCAVSVIVAAEVQFGIRKTPGSIYARRSQQLLDRLVILPLGKDVAFPYSEIRTALESLGTPIGANDLWIAAHALALDATLVTAHEREFRRVPGLRVENWTA